MESFSGDLGLNPRPRGWVAKCAPTGLPRLQLRILNRMNVSFQICENVSLYAGKYREEFDPFMGKFVEAVWTLLSSVGQTKKHDLVSEN